MRPCVVPLALSLTLGACGGVPMSDVRPLAISIPAGDARVFDRLTELVHALGYVVLDADASAGVFAVESRRWARPTEPVRFVVQCYRDGFASIAVERRAAGAVTRVEAGRRGGVPPRPARGRGGVPRPRGRDAPAPTPRRVGSRVMSRSELALLTVLASTMARPVSAQPPAPPIPDTSIVADAAAPAVVAETPATPSVESWPTTPGGRPDAIVDPHVHHGHDAGRIIAGIATFAVGYVGAIIAAAVDEAGATCVIDQPTGYPDWVRLFSGEREWRVVDHLTRRSLDLGGGNGSGILASS